MNNFFTKYFKYKKKYLLLKKNQSGGSVKPYRNVIIEDNFFTKKIKSFCNKNNINMKEASLAELGCGQGIESLILSDSFKKVFGFDPSNYMIENANLNKNNSNKTNVEFNIGNFMTDIKKYNNNEPFDMILLKNSIHYIENVEEVLEKLINDVKIGGFIIIFEPTDKSKFGDDELNNKGEKREKKLKRLTSTKEKVLNFNKLLKHEYIDDKGINIFIIKRF